MEGRIVPIEKDPTKIIIDFSKKNVVKSVEEFSSEVKKIILQDYNEKHLNTLDLILEQISQVKNLTSLLLCRCKFTKKSMELLMLRVNAHCSLRNFSAFYCDFSFGGTVSLGSLLPHTLLQLHLSFVTHSLHALEELTCQEKPPSLISLAVGGVFEKRGEFFTQKKVKILKKCISYFPTLEAINVEGFDYYGQPNLKKFLLAMANLPLKKLNLKTWANKEDDFNAEGMVILKKYLPKLTRLEYLNLEENRIDNKGIKMLGSCFPEMSSLTRLNLRKNFFDDVGLTLLADNLPQTEITHLEVDSRFEKSSPDIYSRIQKTLNQHREYIQNWSRAVFIIAAVHGVRSHPFHTSFIALIDSVMNFLLPKAPTAQPKDPKVEAQNPVVKVQSEAKTALPANQPVAVKKPLSPLNIDKFMNTLFYKSQINMLFYKSKIRELNSKRPREEEHIFDGQPRKKLRVN